MGSPEAGLAQHCPTTHLALIAGLLASYAGNMPQQTRRRLPPPVKATCKRCWQVTRLNNRASRAPGSAAAHPLVNLPVGEAEAKGVEHDDGRLVRLLQHAPDEALDAQLQCRQGQATAGWLCRGGLREAGEPSMAALACASHACPKNDSFLPQP